MPPFEEMNGVVFGALASRGNGEVLFDGDKGAQLGGNHGGMAMRSATDGDQLGTTLSLDVRARPSMN